MSLDIVLGPMFAGKTSYILSLISRHSAIGSNVYVIKNAHDVRYENSEENIVAHCGRTARCASTLDLFRDEILLNIGSADVIIVDEAQFFNDLVPFVEHVVDTLGKQLYLVGLDGDSSRKPFGKLLDCIPLADRIHRLTALCRYCANGTPAIFTKRIHGTHDQQVIIGGKETYAPVCRKCYLRDFKR